MQHSTELIKQANHYNAVRNRLWNAKPKAKIEAPKPKPQMFVLRDFDEHVRAWRKWKLFSETMARAATIATFNVNGSFDGAMSNYPYDVAFVLGAEPAEIILPKRSVRDICMDVLRGFPGVTLAEVKGAHRTRHIVAARQSCMYAVKVEREDLSYPVIGKWFGGRDHTTVMHSVNKIKAQREKERA